MEDNELDKLLQTDLQGTLQRIQNDPRLAQAVKDRMEREQRQGRVSTGIQLLQNVGLTINALSQISQANRAIGQLQTPAIPTPPGRSPELTQAMYEARRGTIDPSSVIAPARQGIEDAYSSALGQAKMASGGQAGAYQSLGQLANVERMRANLGLAPVATQVQLQNQGVYNNLLGQRLGETQNNFQNQLWSADIANNRFDNQTNAIGALGQAGRMNLFNGAQGLSGALQAAAPYYNRFRPFDNDTNDYMKRVEFDNAYNTANSRLA